MRAHGPTLPHDAAGHPPAGAFAAWHQRPCWCLHRLQRLKAIHRAYDHEKRFKRMPSRKAVAERALRQTVAQTLSARTKWPSTTHIWALGGDEASAARGGARPGCVGARWA